MKHGGGAKHKQTYMLRRQAWVSLMVGLTRLRSLRELRRGRPLLKVSGNISSLFNSGGMKVVNLNGY